MHLVGIVLININIILSNYYQLINCSIDHWCSSLKRFRFWNEKFKSKSDCQCHRNSLRDHESCLSLAVFASFTTLLKLEFMILFAPNAKCVQHIQKCICLNYICPNCEGPSLRDHGSPHRVCHWLCSPLSPHSWNLNTAGTNHPSLPAIWKFECIKVWMY